MTEETAIRIAEALESIDDAMGGIIALGISWTVIFVFAYIFFYVSKDWDEKEKADEWIKTMSVLR